MSRSVRLAVWSGPRSISTALMRSWENRPDTRVVDEPLYAWYLAESGVDHPGREEVIAEGETSWRKVVAELTGPVEGIYYQKHMAHHLLPSLPRDWIGDLTNVLLIRDPAEVVASYLESRSRVTAADIGLAQQVELYEQFSGALPVIDAGDFLRRPKAYLRWLCNHVGVDFSEKMLSWPAGPRPSDGSWAPYWYRSVLRSTGFEPYRPRAARLSGAPAELTRQLRPLYERLYGARITL